MIVPCAGGNGSWPRNFPKRSVQWHIRMRMQGQSFMCPLTRPLSDDRHSKNTARREDLSSVKPASKPPLLTNERQRHCDASIFQKGSLPPVPPPHQANRQVVSFVQSVKKTCTRTSTIAINGTKVTENPNVDLVSKQACRKNKSYNNSARKHSSRLPKDT